MRNSPSRKKGAATEVYGFVGWIASFVGFITFSLWAFLPDSTLHSLGITYYPNRYWAIAIPIHILVSSLFITVVYLSFNLINTAPPQSLDLISDPFANYEEEPLLGEDSIPPIGDIPIDVVNEILYIKKD